jgi:hypothetical protein
VFSDQAAICAQFSLFRAHNNWLALKLLYLIMNQVAIKDPDLQLLPGDLALYQTSKRYQDNDFMNFYIHEILAPYWENLRDVMHGPTRPVFLIMDNYLSHSKPQLLALYRHYNIHMISLPPHSSHFLQLTELVFWRIVGKVSKAQQEDNDAPVARQGPED